MGLSPWRNSAVGVSPLLLCRSRPPGTLRADHHASRVPEPRGPCAPRAANDVGRRSLQRCGTRYTKCAHALQASKSGFFSLTTSAGCSVPASAVHCSQHESGESHFPWFFIGVYHVFLL
jgi:hypothetical protein